MHFKLKRILLIALALLLVAVPVLAQDGGTAQVRFVHAIPGASAIDVYVDGQVAASDLSYGTATTYIEVSAGAHQISATQAGSTDALWEQDINPAGGTSLTLIAASASESVFTVFQDDLNPLTLGKTRFTAIHAIAGADAVDVILDDGRPVIPGLQYNQPYGTLDLPVMAYNLAVVPMGAAISDALIPAETFSLDSGTYNALLVYGTGDSPQTMLLTTATQPESAGGYVRIVHSVPGAPAVDVYVNNTLIAPALDFGVATGFIAMPSGSYTLTANTAGTNNEIATATFDVSADGYQTVVLNGSAEAPAAAVMTDDLSAVDAETSVFTLINSTASATTAATLADGAALMGEVATGSSDSALVAAGTTGIVVMTNADGSIDETTLGGDGLYGGMYYSAIAVDGADGVEVIELPPVSLARSVSGGQQVAAEPTQIAFPTEAPTEEPTQAVVEAQPEVQPTEAPTEDVVILAQPTVAPTTTGPTARVLLDPGVNLQLRQYPNREAFSLGLAPSGSVLRVNGRVGEPVPAPDTTATPLPPDATPFVDPVTELEDGEDLNAADTWLNVTFDTPDGGTITAWVNALYLGLRDAQGRSQRLRDLPTVPSNQAGQSVNTAMEPPTARQNPTMAITTNLDPGVRTHIRRLPSTGGESLALVPSGTQLEFVGVNEDRDWVYVRYQAPQSTVSGWINTEYVTLQRNGQAVDFDRLVELGELSVISDDQRGNVVTTGQATASIADELRNVVAGTVVGLNADANLHLRRYDNDQAESLALLPNGTQLIVTGRSVDDVWLQVSYQNQSGWVSSQYIDLSFNGQPYELESLPVIDNSTPTPTPTTEG